MVNNSDQDKIELIEKLSGKPETWFGWAWVLSSYFLVSISIACFIYAIGYDGYRSSDFGITTIVLGFAITNFLDKLHRYLNFKSAKEATELIEKVDNDNAKKAA